MRPTRYFLSQLAVLAAIGLLVTASPAAAADPAPLLASGYWDRFVDWWLQALKKQDGIVLVVLGVGIVSVLIIITSAKRVK